MTPVPSADEFPDPPPDGGASRLLPERSTQTPPQGGVLSAGPLHRSQQVENTLRALASVQPPSVAPELSAGWRHPVTETLRLPALQDAGAAAAEAMVCGGADAGTATRWREACARQPVLAAALARSAGVERILTCLPEISLPDLPAAVRESFRQALPGGEAGLLLPEPPPAPGQNRPDVRRKKSGRAGWRAAGWAALGGAAAAAVVLPALRLPYPPPHSGPAVLAQAPRPETSPPVPPAAMVRKEKRANAPLTSSSFSYSAAPGHPGLPEKKSAAHPPSAGSVGELAGSPPETGDGPGSAPAGVPPQPEPSEPPPGSLEALHPVILAGLTTAPPDPEGSGSAGAGPPPGTVWRSAVSGRGPAVDLMTRFRSPGSSHLTDEGNEQFAALARVLQEPLLEDEPYFLIDDHSLNDLDISRRRAAAVCALLTKFGVPASRLRAGGKGRFEWRGGDPPDAARSRITIRPATARYRVSAPSAAPSQ